MIIFPKKFFEFFCLAVIGLMWIWPFLYYKHAFPITAFYQEWGAALLGFTVGFLILLKNEFWQQAAIPRSVLLPLGLALVVFVQSEAGLLPSFEQAMLVFLYLFWAALLIVAGFYLRQRVGLPLLAMALASFLLLGTELAALIGIVQHFKWHSFLDPYLTAKLMPQVYGNLGQPNHYANYVTLGVISLLYLNSKKKIAALPALFLVLPLLLAIALSGSRSSWFYFIAIALLSYFFHKRDSQSAPPLLHVLVLMAGLLLMNGLLLLPWFSGGALDSLTPLERMYSAVNSSGSVGGSAYGGSVRLYLWHEAALMFLHSPWLGVGFGQFTWQHFQMLPSLQATHITGLYNNAHNLLFQLAAETGIAGLLVLFCTLIPWLMRARRVPPSMEAWWGQGILSVLFIHSLLEYPLWYTYFIGIAAFLLGMLDEGTFRLRMPIVYRIPAMVVLIFGLASIQQLYANYRLLENVLADRPSSASDNAYLTRVWQNLAQVQKNSVFRPYAEIFMGLTMDAVPASIENKLALCERIVTFSPNAAVVYRYALMLAVTNRTDEAKLQVERSIWSYPEGFAAFRAQLAQLEPAAPGKFSALLKDADEKMAQRQNMVR